MRRAWTLALVLGLGGCGAAATIDRVDGTVVVHANERERAAITRARERIRAAEERRWAAGDAVVEATRELRLASIAAQQPGERDRGRLDAARDYAAWLVAERRARFEVASAEEELATIELAIVKLDVVQRAGVPINVEATATLDALQDAQRALADARQRAALTAGALAKAHDRLDPVAAAAAASPARR